MTAALGAVLSAHSDQSGSLTSPMEICIASRTYDPVGFCIYCGARDAQLTEEHIVPYGLRGRWVLPEASCKECAEETGRFENDVLQKLFGNFRYRLGAFPPRKGKGRKRRTTFRVEREDRDRARSTEDLPLKRFPLFVCMPLIFGPKLLFSKDPGGEFLWRWHDDDDIKRFVAEVGGRGQFTAAELHLTPLLRMIAKIAHSWAYASYSPETIAQFDLYLDEYIRFGTGDPAPFIGARPIAEVHSRFMNEVALLSVQRGDTEYLVSKVRLLAILAAPTFLVVVGSRKTTPTTPPLRPVRTIVS